MGKAAQCWAVLGTYQNVFKLWVFSLKPKAFFQHCNKKSLGSRNSFMLTAGIWNKQSTTTRNVWPHEDIQYSWWFWLALLKDMKWLRSVTAGYIGYIWDTGITLCALPWITLGTSWYSPRQSALGSPSWTSQPPEIPSSLSCFVILSGCGHYSILLIEELHERVMFIVTQDLSRRMYFLESQYSYEHN